MAFLTPKKLKNKESYMSSPAVIRSITAREAITEANSLIVKMQQQEVQLDRKVLDYMSSEGSKKLNNPHFPKLCLAGYGISILFGIVTVGVGGRALVSLIQDHLLAYIVNTLFGVLFAVLTNDVYRTTRGIDLAAKLFNKVLQDDAIMGKPRSMRLEPKEAIEYTKSFTQIEDEANLIFLLPNIFGTINVASFFWPAEQAPAVAAEAQAAK
jgi:hypothetical protein